MINDTLKRTSSYSSNRCNHLTDDGRYVYWHWDDELKKEVPIYLTPGKDGVTQEIILALDSWDHDEDLGERYEEEHADYSFQNHKTVYNTDGEAYELAADTTDLLEAVGGDPFSILFPDEEIANTRIEQISAFLQKLTPAQLDLYYSYFGEMKRLTEILQEENVANGTDKSLQSVLNRVDKIIARACKEFGVEKPQRKGTK